MTSPSVPLMDDRDWDRLARFVTRESSPDEAESTQLWIDADPARRQLYARLRDAWDVAKVDRSRWNSAAALQRARLHLDMPSFDSPPQAAHAHRHIAHSAHRTFAPLPAPRYRSAIAIAAGIVLVVGIATTWRIVAGQRAAASMAAVPVPMTEVATRRAQRATIQLGDGTKITLNVESKLRYAQDYGVASRELYLEGEAFFDVAHGSIPFIVRTAQGIVRDIGTRFAVTAYANVPETRVVVSDGAVVLSAATARRSGDSIHAALAGAVEHDSLILTAATLGTATESTLRMTRGVDIADHLAWLEGRLVFAGTPLLEVVQRLSRWYDIDIQLGDPSLELMQFRGSFHSANRDYVLTLLAASAGAQLEKSGDAYVLFPRR